MGFWDFLTTPAPSPVIACTTNAYEACPGSTYPSFPGDISASPSHVYQSDFADGVTVTWRPEDPTSIKNCDESYDDIKLICHFSDGDLEVTPDSAGRTIITKKLYAPLSSAVFCDLVYYNPNNDEVERIDGAIRLHSPMEIPDSPDLGPCDYNPSPVIKESFAILWENLSSGESEAYVGDMIKISFPKDGVEECDETTDDLKVTFLVDGEPVTSSSDVHSYYAVITFDESKGANPYKIGMKVEDESRPEAVPQYAETIDIYVGEELVCYSGSIPNPGAVYYTPDIVIVKGDNTFFIFTAEGMQDCLGGDLSLYSTNAMDVLYDESAVLASQTLTVSGRIRASINPEASLTAHFLDTWGNSKIINITLPPRITPTIEIPNAWPFQSDDLEVGLDMDPAGADFEWIVTPPTGPSFGSGLLTGGSSQYIIPAGSKSMIGVYGISVDVTSEDLHTYTLIDSFTVHAD